MTLSACGIICEECPFFGKECQGCHAVEGRPFWASEHLPEGHCPIHQCSVDKKGYVNCGGCSDLPCNIFYELKDPSVTKEEHLKGIEKRRDTLRSFIN